jgi:hypothetical protein
MCIIYVFTQLFFKVIFSVKNMANRLENWLANINQLGEQETAKFLERFTDEYADKNAEGFSVIVNAMESLCQIFRENPLTAINFLKFFKVFVEIQSNLYIVTPQRGVTLIIIFCIETVVGRSWLGLLLI